MGAFRQRVNGALSAYFPEKRLFIQSGNSTRYLRISPLSQIMSGAASLAVVGWVAVATATLAIDFAGGSGVGPAVVIQEAYGARLEELAGERDTRAAEARSAQARFQTAMDQISRQQTALLNSEEERRELDTALGLMRDRMQDAVRQRDTVAAANDRLLAQMDDVSRQLDAGTGADATETLKTVTAALSEAVVARDAATGAREDLTRQIADLELRERVNSRRQDEMVDELEQAVALSFGPMEKLFKTANLDVDSLIEKVRGSYSGEGGPAGAPIGGAVVSTRSFDGGALNGRVDKLMTDLDRMNLMRVAVEKVPYTMPVTSTYRFTSPFGRRWGRMHAGVDLAAPVGTPIYATADGVVVVAGRESGYGNVVRIQHEFGFETVYAHQSRIRVKVGQQVSRGVQIGDMGSTGRSTGSHLHYEVRVNGQPVNPMTYLEAAKDVFQVEARR